MSETAETSENVDVSRIDWIELEDPKFRWGNFIDVIETFDETARVKIDEILNQPFNENFSRNVAEVVIAKSALENLTPEQKVYLNRYLESFVSLSEIQVPELEDCALLVLGNNAPDRQSDLELLSKNLEDARKLFSDTESGVEPSGGPLPYKIERLTPTSDPEVVDQFKKLAADVDTSPEEVDEGLSEDETLYFVSVLEKNGAKEVIGTAHVTDDSFYVYRNGKKIEINRVEPGGAVTKTEYRGKGVYRSLLETELRELARRIPPVHLVQGYTKLDEKVFRAIAKTGRKLSSPAAEQMGLFPHGSPKHWPNEKGVLVDHVMTFMPRGPLVARYGVK